MDAQGVDVQVVSIHTPFFGYHLDAAQGAALARDVNDEIAGMTQRIPAALRGPCDAADAGRQGGDRRAGARGDAARTEGGRARHQRERRAVGRAEVSAVLQGRRGHGRRAVLSPAAAEQLPRAAHPALRAVEQPRRPARRRDRHGGPDLRRRAGGVPGPARVHRARRRAGVLRHGAARPQLARASGRRATSRSRRASTSVASTTTPSPRARRRCGS